MREVLGCKWCQKFQEKRKPMSTRKLTIQTEDLFKQQGSKNSYLFANSSFSINKSVHTFRIYYQVYIILVSLYFNALPLKRTLLVHCNFIFKKNSGKLYIQ